MTAVQSMAPNRSTPIQVYARIAGVLFLLSVIAGGFGEFYVPSIVVVANDATATAHNVLAHETWFRVGVSGYLIEAICDIVLTLYLYVLVKPAGRTATRVFLFAVAEDGAGW